MLRSGTEWTYNDADAEQHLVQLHQNGWKVRHWTAPVGDDPEDVPEKMRFRPNVKRETEYPALVPTGMYLDGPGTSG